MPDKTIEEPRYESEPIILGKVGMWKGVKLTADRLRRYAENFAAMAKHGVRPTNTLGHDTKEFRAAKALDFRFVDGWPDLGEATKMWFDEKSGTLWTVLGNMPKKLADAVNKRLFKDISLHAEYEYHDDIDNVTRHDVIRHVGILGVQWPGIKGTGTHLEIAREVLEPATLADGDYWIALSDIESIEDVDDGGGEDDMAGTEELTKRIADLEAKQKEFEAHETVTKMLMAKLEVQDVTALPDALEKWLADAEQWKAGAAELTEQKELAEKAAAEAKEKAKVERVTAAVNEAAKVGAVAAGNIKGEVAVMCDMDDDPSNTITFADADGNDAEGTKLDRALALLKRRQRIPGLTMSDVAAAGEGVENAHPEPEKPDPETEKREALAEEAHKMFPQLTKEEILEHGFNEPEPI